MSLGAAIANLASWAGNTNMPKTSGLLLAGAVNRYSKGGSYALHSHVRNSSERFYIRMPAER